MADLDDLKVDVENFWKIIETLMSSIKELYERSYKQNKNLNDIVKKITGIRSRIDTLEKRQHKE